MQLQSPLHRNVFKVHLNISLRVTVHLNYQRSKCNIFYNIDKFQQEMNT